MPHDVSAANAAADTDDAASVPANLPLLLLALLPVATAAAEAVDDELNKRAQMLTLLPLPCRSCR